MKNPAKFLVSQSISTQIICLLLVLILPMNIIMLLSSIQIQDAHIRQSRASIEQTANLYISELNKNMRSVESFLFMSASENIYVSKLMNHIPGTDYVVNINSYWQELQERTSWYDDADGYFLYLESENHFDVALSKSYRGKQPFKDFFSDFDYVNSRGKWIALDIDGEKWIATMYSIRGFYYGALININKFENYISENLILQDANIRIVPFEEPAEIDDIVYVSNDKEEFTAIIQYKRQSLMDQIPILEQSFVIIGVIYLACIPLLIFIIRRLFVIPMTRLNNAMDELESGNQDYRMKPASENRESHELTVKFNSMASKLTDLKIKVYEKELERMDIEATNLRLQVNPHFILNCLNVIFSLAKSGNLDNIKSFTKYLADYLRFSLWHTHGNVRMQQEITCIDNYLSIQQMRSPNQFTYIFNVAPDVMDVMIPPQLILNFVENSTKHGIMPGKEIEISVTARKENDELFISICDTGKGMDEETKQALLEGNMLEDENGKHIGIWNCIRRLKMLYGRRAAFNITSSEGHGTQIFIKMPIEEDKNDTADC